jgi:hypothetical protein
MGETFNNLSRISSFSIGHTKNNLKIGKSRYIMQRVSVKGNGNRVKVENLQIYRR